MNFTVAYIVFFVAGLIAGLAITLILISRRPRGRSLIDLGVWCWGVLLCLGFLYAVFTIETASERDLNARAPLIAGIIAGLGVVWKVFYDASVKSHNMNDQRDLSLLRMKEAELIVETVSSMQREIEAAKTFRDNWQRKDAVRTNRKIPRRGWNRDGK